MFNDMAGKPNADLDERINDDGCSMRYPVMKQQEPLELLMPD